MAWPWHLGYRELVRSKAFKRMEILKRSQGRERHKTAFKVPLNMSTGSGGVLHL